MNTAPKTLHCQSVKENLILFLEKELSGEIIQAMDHHLEFCEDCRAAHNQVQETLAVILKDRIIPCDPYFIPRLLAKQENIPLQPVFFRKLRPVYLTLAVIGGMAAGILAGNTLHQGFATGAEASRSHSLNLFAEEILISEITQTDLENILFFK